MATIKEILANNPNWTAINHDNLMGTDKNIIHSYVDDFYEIYFSKYREKKIKLLEVGVLHGKSLLLWDEYFIKNKGIWGVDISDERVVEEAKERERIHIEIGDAYTEEMAARLPNFDIIIDDGPHTLESQVKFINLYLDKLNPDGIMVIEDVQDPSWFDTLQGALPNDDKIFAERVDLRWVKGRYDDLIFCIKRRS